MGRLGQVHDSCSRGDYYLFKNKVKKIALSFRQVVSVAEDIGLTDLFVCFLQTITPRETGDVFLDFQKINK